MYCSSRPPFHTFALTVVHATPCRISDLLSSSHRRSNASEPFTDTVIRATEAQRRTRLSQTTAFGKQQTQAIAGNDNDTYSLFHSIVSPDRPSTQRATGAAINASKNSRASLTSHAISNGMLEERTIHARPHHAHFPPKIDYFTGPTPDVATGTSHPSAKRSSIRHPRASHGRFLHPESKFVRLELTALDRTKKNGNRRGVITPSHEGDYNDDYGEHSEEEGSVSVEHGGPAGF
jgi:hypothetical protein